AGRAEISEVDGGNRAARTTFESRQGQHVELCSTECGGRQAESIGADIEAIGVSADQRLVTGATGRTPAETGVAVIGNIQHVHVPISQGIVALADRDKYMSFIAKRAGTGIGVDFGFRNEEMTVHRVE